MDKEEKDKEEKDMGAITGDQSKVNKTSEGISKSFLKTAKRLPRKDGKIVLIEIILSMYHGQRGTRRNNAYST